LAPAASLVSVHHFKRLRTGLVGPVSAKETGWGIMFICAWYFGVLAHLKIRLESGQPDLTTTVLHSYNLVINDIPFT